MPSSTGETADDIPFRISSEADPTNYIEVANVVGFNLAGEAQGEVDFTLLRSPGRYREMRPGKIDPGSITIDLHFDPTKPEFDGADARSLRSRMAAGEVFGVEIPLVNANGTWTKAWHCKGFVTNPGDVPFAIDTPITASVTIRRTGPTTIDTVP